MQIAYARFQISYFLPFVDVVSYKLSASDNMISLAIWCVKHLKIFQRLQIVPVLRVWAILIYLKKLLVLIYTKLREKSCQYFYKFYVNSLNYLGKKMRRGT